MAHSERFEGRSASKKSIACAYSAEQPADAWSGRRGILRQALEGEPLDPFKVAVILTAPKSRSLRLARAAAEKVVKAQQ